MLEEDDSSDSDTEEDEDNNSIEVDNQQDDKKERSETEDDESVVSAGDMEVEEGDKNVDMVYENLKAETTLKAHGATQCDGTYDGSPQRAGPFLRRKKASHPCLCRIPVSQCARKGRN
jgi:hypothetical protein